MSSSESLWSLWGVEVKEWFVLRTLSDQQFVKEAGGQRSRPADLLTNRTGSLKEEFKVQPEFKLLKQTEILLQILLIEVVLIIITSLMTGAATHTVCWCWSELRESIWAPTMTVSRVPNTKEALGSRDRDGLIKTPSSVLFTLFIFSF